MLKKIISRPDQSSSNSCAAIIVAAGSGVRAASTSKFASRQDSPFGHDNFVHDDFEKDSRYRIFEDENSDCFFFDCHS